MPSKKSKREYGRSFKALLVLSLATAFLAGCGGDEEQGSTEPRDEPPATQTATTETAPAADIKDTSQKPVIEKPTGKVPRRLVREDIVKGKGKVARKGSQLTVHYVGVTFSHGDQFDASWDSGQPFEFQLGAGNVIPGWDRGLVGMREGGRRKLTIPPDLAYGAQGSGSSIGPNETLVFVVDAVKVR
jgi:peptidylprolyl isomerase